MQTGWGQIAFSKVFHNNSEKLREQWDLYTRNRKRKVLRYGSKIKVFNELQFKY